MDVGRSFHFKRLEKLERWLKRRDIVQAVDYQRFVDDKVISLGTRLAVPYDAPSWGLSHRPQDSDSTGFTELLEYSVQVAIDVNREMSERARRYIPLYLGAMVISLLIVAGALFVDFQILNEFWTRAMFPDFARELADTFGGSAFAKSLQVVFATLAFHFFLGSLSASGRKVFIGFIFLVSLSIVVGLGLLNAGVTNPNAGANEPAARSLEDVLGDLGLSEGEILEEEDQTFSDQVNDAFEGVQSVAWIFVPSVVFLVVTGIAALFTQAAETNARNIVRAMEYRERRRLTQEFEEMTLCKALIDRLVGQPQAYDDGGDSYTLIEDARH